MVPAKKAPSRVVPKGEFDFGPGGKSAKTVVRGPARKIFVVVLLTIDTRPDLPEDGSNSPTIAQAKHQLGLQFHLGHHTNEELAIGAPRSGSQEEGAVAVVRLSSDSPKIEGGFVIEKVGLPSGVVGDSTKLGRSLAGGDVDGDGRSEVWAGAYEVGGGGEGLVWEAAVFDEVSDNGDWTDDDYTLPASSPAVDAGPPGDLDLDGSAADMGYWGGPHAP